MITEFEKFTYYDLRLEAESGRLPKITGREDEVSRLLRIISSTLGRHSILVAESGVGKSSIIFGLAERIARTGWRKGLPVAMLEPNSASRIGLLREAGLGPYLRAFESLTRGVIVLDGFGEWVYEQPNSLSNWNSLIKPLLNLDEVSLILAMQPKELEWLKVHKSHFVARFQIVNIDPLPMKDSRTVLINTAKRLENETLKIEASAIEAALNLPERFKRLGPLPKSGMALLDEAVTELRINPLSFKFNKVNHEIIERVTASKLHLPLAKVAAEDIARIKSLPEVLKKSVLGQDKAISEIAGFIQRSKLGLRNPDRPLASFLLLGPSGVGKTETAKTLSDIVFGGTGFLRLDMSEFAAEHSVARLIGSPPGYVGYDVGGQLTTHLESHPHSLILLDEIEKAHPKIFDIFLQVLDDGRLTSSQGVVIDATQCIFIATSNLAVDEILKVENSDTAEYLSTNIIPELQKFLRTEFLNRFDSLVVFKKLSEESLVQIALKEITKMEDRFKNKGIKFKVDPVVLKSVVASQSDPRFGARPIKRLVEKICETAVVDSLLNSNQ